MSLPQQPPPVMAYPNSITAQPQPPSRHSDGSFGTVFIVLAVIVVVSGVACFLGRLCNRKLQGPKTSPKVKQSQGSHHQGPRPREREPPEFSFRHKPKDPEFNFGSKEKGPEFNFRPKERDPEFNFRAKESDLEFGFGKGIPGGGKPSGNGENRASKPPQKGDFRGDPKHGFYNGDPRSRA